MEKLGIIPVRNKVEDIIGIYKSAQDKLKEKLLMMDIMEFSDIMVAQVQTETNRIVKSLDRQTIGWSISAAIDGYKDMMKKNTVSLEVLGAEKNPYFDNKIHYQTINKYSDAMTNDLLKANLTIRNTVNSLVYFMKQASSGLKQIQAFTEPEQSVITDIIAETMIKGRERYYASSKIMEFLRRQFLDGQFIDRKGRHYNLRDYSEMVARTRLREMQTEGVENICEQYENDLVQFSSHANPCQKICAPLEGQIFSLSGKHPKYPYLPKDKRPPCHPNCEHNLTPTSELAIEMRSKFA